MNNFRFDALPTVINQRSKKFACLFLAALGLASAAHAAPPTISAIPSQGTFPSTTNRLISFTVGDAEDSPSALIVTGTSSDQGILLNTNIGFGGSGSSRTLSLVPTSGEAGPTLVNVVVTDSEGLSATNTFEFDVNYFTALALGIPTNVLHPRWVDGDKDGDLDISTSSGIYINVGRTNFVTGANQGVVWRSAVDWGDYDNDGDPDLAMGNSNGAFIYRNNGGLNFSFNFAGLTGTLVETMSWADYDNDGKLDLLSTGGWDQPSQTFTRLYHNDGNAFTVNTNSGIPPMARAATAWGDFDRDGYLDLLINGLHGGSSTSWRTYIYRNLGNGTFTNLNAGLYGLSEGSVSIADFDNDGDLDLLSSGFNFGSYQLRVYRNDGNNTFTDINVGLQGSASGEAQWVDFDNDGYSDIFIAGCTMNSCAASITTIYRNNRDGTFSNIATGLPVAAGSSASWGDFDGDGDLDLFHLGLYRNNSPTRNSAPTAPTALVTEYLADNNIRLSWTAPADLENSNPAGLSYVVSVGTSPGASDYVPAHANLTNGFRRLPKRGPVATNSVLLINVPPATYHWSVQAIDAGFAGSSFASAATFTPTNTRPTISAIANQATVPGRAIGPISFTVSDAETPATFLTLSATSSNTNVIAVTNIVFGGSGSSRTVTITPGGLSGTASISIRVADSTGLMATSSLAVAVEALTPVSVGLTPSSAPTAFGDFDNDDKLDIAKNGIVYKNIGASYTNFFTSLPVRKDNDLAWVDYDNDGDIDLSETGWDNNGYGPISYIFRSNASNSLTHLSNLQLLNVADGSIAWGDYDNDGDADALITGDPDTYHTPTGATRLCRNIGGTFTNSGIVFPPVCRGAGIWGDLDNDGDLDIILTGQTNSSHSSAITKVYRNDRNNVFTEIATNLPAITRCAIALGDCDKDGDLDIAFSGEGTNTVPVAGVYLNNGHASFTNSGAAMFGSANGTVAWGDYNNDGYLDLELGGSPRLYLNISGTSFTNTGTTLPEHSGSSSSSWGDYDKDGDLDLLLGMRMLRNNYNLSNTPPTIPPFPHTTVSSNRQVRFRWLKSSDLESGTNGLSYNLRIGTTPGGSQIMSAQSNPTTGYRRVPQMGNAGQTNSWTITLTNGTYYWSVQAVDGGNVGSPFAPEQTLVFSNDPPIAFTQLTREVMEDQTLALTLTGADANGDSLTFIVTAPPTNGMLVGTPPNVTYRPNTNYFGNDTLKFVAHDGITNSATASVSIKVTPVDDVANSSMQLTRGTSQLQMTISGEPHQKYTLLVSTNLVQWTNLTNLQCNRFSGSATWSETNLSDARRFYRLQELP